MQTAEVIRYASNLSVLVPFLVYAWNIRRVPGSLHAIGVVVITSGVCDLITFFLSIHKISAEYMFNLQDVLQYGGLAWFYFDILFRGNAKLENAFGFGHYVISFLLFTIGTELLTYQEGIWVASSVLLVGYAIASFIKLYRTTPKDYIWKLGITWINAGVLVYFSLVVWFYLFMGQLLKLPPETFKTIWAAHNTLNIVKYIFFSVGIFYTTRTIHVTINSNQRNPGYVSEERNTVEESSKN